VRRQLHECRITPSERIVERHARVAGDRDEVAPACRGDVATAAMAARRRLIGGGDEQSILRDHTDEMLIGRPNRSRGSAVNGWARQIAFGARARSRDATNPRRRACHRAQSGLFDVRPTVSTRPLPRSSASRSCLAVVTKRNSDSGRGR